jgi:hypothetical protein
MASHKPARKGKPKKLGKKWIGKGKRVLPRKGDNYLLGFGEDGRNGLAVLHLRGEEMTVLAVGEGVRYHESEYGGIDLKCGLGKGRHTCIDLAHSGEGVDWKYRKGPLSRGRRFRETPVYVQSFGSRKTLMAELAERV